MKKLVTGAAIVVASVGTLLAGTAAPAQAYSSNYGAIAVDLSSETYGYSYDYSSASEAEAAAETQCRTHGGGYGCTAKISWRNGCGALSVSRNYWAYGSGATVGRARSKALSNNPGSGAYILHWNCTSGYGL
ncbi:DUF4189 domain-containing protein [Nocardia callitridis]|uniref:DUF4189 domain-containing protein n=1 Tax=Nocardia callitridis TaxID=648753 RepID=A0ABP9KFL4_9NOCA